MGNGIYRQLVFQPPPMPTYTLYNPRRVTYIDIPNTKIRIPTYFIRAKNPESRTTILYSHGNASDMGDMNEFLTTLHENLPNVNIFHYDYIGYGLARDQGYATEKNCNEACEASLNYLLNNVGLEMCDIIAMGTSVGSGPACSLITKYRRLKGLILECPFASCMHVVMKPTAVKLLKSQDMFANYKKINRLKCPIIIFHGKKDTTISISNSKILLDKVPKSLRFRFVQVDGADHNDILYTLGVDEFIRLMKEFIDHCDKEIEKRMKLKEFEHLRKRESGIGFIRKDPTIAFSIDALEGDLNNSGFISNAMNKDFDNCERIRKLDDGDEQEKERVKDLYNIYKYLYSD